MRVLAGSCTQNSTPFHIFSFFMKTHTLAPGARSAVLKLYAGACAPVHLLAVGAPLYLDKEGNG